jgi:hypothetical protein
VSLTPGEYYKFKVIARNSVGLSPASEEISILAALAPDAVISVANDPAVTNAYQVKLTWSKGPYNGGSPIIDYTVSYKLSTDTNYQVYSTVTAQTETIQSLTPGANYDFVVQARNLIGLSVESTPITVKAAQIPDEPTTLANVPLQTTSSQVSMTWVAPVFDGGSPVIDYSVWYDNASGSTF